MSMQLARVNRALNKPDGTPWPETFTVKQIAYFATWRSDNEPRPDWSARAAPLFDFLHIACERGELEHTTTTERVLAPITRPRLLNTGKPRPTIEVIRHHIAAAPLARWLEAQDVQPGELLQAWFKSQGVGVAAVEAEAPAPAARPEAVLRPSPAAPAAAESWHIKQPERAHGYNLELYRVLKAAHDAGQPRPTARDVLDSWTASKPPNILEVMTDEFKYLDSSGSTKTVGLKALRKAIDRMASARQEADRPDKNPISPTRGR